MTTRTAAQQRGDRRSAFDSYLEGCPTTQLMASMSNRWVMLVVCTLGAAPGPLRYNQLCREIPGVSQKMMTQTLRSLEREGLVTRTVKTAVPVQVEYELTALGESLRDLLGVVRDWADRNTGLLQQARARHDAGRAAV